METIVYLIRHSEPLENNAIIKVEENSQISNEKIILTVHGEEKARKLSRQKELQNIDILWSSHYCRAISTAKYIAEKNRIPINIDSNLGERRLGDLEELSKIERTKKFSYTTEQLLDCNLKNREGENSVEVRKRVIKSLNEIIRDNKNKRIVVVSHGADIKYTLLEWCTFNSDTHEIMFKDKVIVGEKMNTPEVIKLSFKNNTLIDIERLDIKLD